MKEIHPATQRIIIFLSILVIIIFLLFWHLSRYELQIVQGQNQILIQTLSLGEYYTPVSKLIIYEKNTNKEIVEFNSKSTNSRLHTITLTPGLINFNEMYLEGYQIQSAKLNSYVFKKRVTYTVQAQWGKRQQSLDFTIN